MHFTAAFLIACILSSPAGHASEAAVAWRKVTLDRVNWLISEKIDGGLRPNRARFMRALRLTTKDRAHQILAGEVDFEYGWAKILGKRFGVDPLWIMAADTLRARFSDEHQLHAAFVVTADKQYPVAKEVYLAYDRLSPEARLNVWPSQEIQSRLVAPKISDPLCPRLLLNYSGQELLELQGRLTQELLERNGNMG